MQIGQSLPLSSRINRALPQADAQVERQPNPTTPNDDNPSDGGRVFAVDYVQVAEQAAQASESREQASFYSMDREFSFRAREALSYYLNNAIEPFAQQAADQYVGVDLYV